MFRLVRTATIALVFLAYLRATDPDRDFSGNWILDARGSNTQSLTSPQERSLACVQQDSILKCSSASVDNSPTVWTYDLNGADTRYKIGDENRNSKVKWEGS